MLVSHPNWYGLTFYYGFRLSLHSRTRDSGPWAGGYQIISTCSRPNCYSLTFEPIGFDCYVSGPSPAIDLAAELRLAYNIIQLAYPVLYK